MPGKIAALPALALAMAISIWGQPVAGLASPGGNHSRTGTGSRELSVSTRLQDRREVSAGTRAYSIGFEDGRFYGNGWHITGEMGGVWAPPLKLADGVWVGVDDHWAGPATRFTSGPGWARERPPAVPGRGPHP